MQELITGIQQVGIGVTDAHEAKLLYKDLFGMDALIFDDKAAASLMTAYTGKQVHNRRAILSLNMSGGGGFEIWQYTSRSAVTATTVAKTGDLGIFATKIKTADVALAHQYFSSQKNILISPVYDHRHVW
jgi:hypothetical protein